MDLFAYTQIDELEQLAQKNGISVPRTFHSLNGEQLYQRCKKCENVIPYIYREYEGMGYK